MEKEDNKKSWAWSKSILGEILEFNVKLDNQINNKSNFIMGAAAIILIFTAGVITKDEFTRYALPLKLGWIVIAAGSFISFLLAITIITPKLRIFSKRERIKEDIFYYKNAIKFYKREEYVKALSKLRTNPDLVIKAFGNQIYSISKNILPLKSRLLKNAGWILVLSLTIGMLLILTNVMGWY